MHNLLLICFIGWSRAQAINEESVSDIKFFNLFFLFSYRVFNGTEFWTKYPDHNGPNSNWFEPVRLRWSRIRRPGLITGRNRISELQKCYFNYSKARIMFVTKHVAKHVTTTKSVIKISVIFEHQSKARLQLRIYLYID